MVVIRTAKSHVALVSATTNVLCGDQIENK